MTKEEKERILLLKRFDNKHIQNFLKQKKVLDLIYDSLAKEAARIGKMSGFDDPDAEFHFEDYPQTLKLIDKLVADFADKIETTIQEGNKREWLLSNDKNTALITSLAASTGIDKKRIEGWTRPNLDALQAFQGRKRNGMGLSDNVWKVGQQVRQELELALDIGLGEGKSAASLSRDVRKYLDKPDMLFRRVRDKHGNLRLSKAAEAFHPGQGRYRSSYKNALRMTATENNMAYRTADHEKWGNLDFIIGQKIQLSNNHTIKNSKGVAVPFHDICDEMVGDYPKDFKFTGWHPFCRCIVTPILADWNEVLENMDNPDHHYEGEITDMPEGYNKCMEKNADRIERAKSLPYWIKDNPQYTNGYTQQKETQPSKFVMTDDVLRQLDDRGFNRQELFIISDNMEEYNKSAIAHFDVLKFDDTMQTVLSENEMTIESSSLSLSRSKEMVFLKYNYRLNDGTEKGELVREFFYNDKEKCVKHSLFELPEAKQGKGISKTIFRELFKQYETSGIDKVFVHANIDVGGLCWAKYGFIGDKEEISLIIKTAYYDRIINKAEFEDAMLIIGQYNKDIPMNRLAYRDYSERLLKRKEVSWYGYVDLHNEKQMDYLHEYLGMNE